MQRLERWLAITGVVVLSVIALAGFCLAIYSALLFHDMPDAADLADYHPPTQLDYWRNGQPGLGQPR